jgi:hypothetical protein
MTSEWEVKHSGPHQVCVQNQMSHEITFELSVQSGELINDRSQAITKKHLRPVEAQAFKVNAMVDELRKELSGLVASEVALSEQNDSIKSRVFVFGLISVAIMGVSTFL